MKKNPILVAKRKQAIARGTITEGGGRVLINNKSLDAYPNRILKLMISEPQAISGDLYKKYDIDMTIKGGGEMARAHAARSIVAKCLARKEKSLKRRFLDYDRTLLVDDNRQTEPQKPYRSSARALKQTSYR